MPAILAFVVMRLVQVLADPRQSLRGVIASRPWHVWLLWALGSVVVLGFCEFDPGLVVYLADPELLAGVMVLMAFQLRRSLQAAWQFADAAGRRSVLRARHARTCASVGLRMYATDVRERLVAFG